MEPMVGFEPTTYPLRKDCSSQLSYIGEILILERVMGIEPTPQPWEGRVLPLYYTREYLQKVRFSHFFNKLL